MLLDDAHLARARRVGYPILTPGAPAYWDEDGKLIKVTVLGGGEYSAVAGTRFGVTVKVTTTSTVTSASRGTIKRGERWVVPPARVVPRSIVTLHPDGSYFYAGHTWAFDLTCPVHGEVHPAPVQSCKFTRMEIALIDEVTDATDSGRVICRIAAQEIVRWYNKPKPGDTGIAARFLTTGELPAGDTHALWTALGGYNLDLEKAEWRRDCLRAVREYIRKADRPRAPHADKTLDTCAYLWELDRDARYLITSERYAEGGEPAKTRMVVWFCGHRVDTAPTPQAARRLAVRHHAGQTHPLPPEARP